MLSHAFRRVAGVGMGVAAGLALLGGVALAWPGYIHGRPVSFEAGGTDGYYVWQGDDGWHLRTTDSSGVYAYAGTLRTDGRFTDVELVKPESDDSVKVLDGGHVLAYRFKTAEGVDGVDFHVDGGDQLRLHLDRNGQLIDPSNIFLGEDSVHPEHDPFTVQR